jgi:hypothetical protein
MDSQLPGKMKGFSSKLKNFRKDPNKSKGQKPPKEGTASPSPRDSSNQSPVLTPTSSTSTLNDPRNKPLPSGSAGLGGDHGGTSSPNNGNINPRLPPTVVISPTPGVSKLLVYPQIRPVCTDHVYSIFLPRALPRRCLTICRPLSLARAFSSTPRITVMPFPKDFVLPDDSTRPGSIFQRIESSRSFQASTRCHPTGARSFSWRRSTSAMSSLTLTMRAVT